MLEARLSQRKRKMILQLMITLAVVALGIALLYPEVHREDVTFNFNPPDKTAYTVTSKLSRQLIGARGLVAVQLDISKETVAKGEYFQTAGVISEAIKTLSVENFLGGEKYNVPEEQAFEGTVQTVQYDSMGQIVNILGLDQLDVQLQKAQTKEDKSPLDKEGYMASKRSEWANKVGFLIGRKKAIGDVIIGLGQSISPDNVRTKYFIGAQNAGKVQIAGHECVRLKFFYSTNMWKIIGYLGLKMLFLDTEERTIVQVATSTSKKMSLNGRGEIILDPTTMLIYSEKIEKTYGWLSKGKVSPDDISIQDKVQVDYKYQ